MPINREVWIEPESINVSWRLNGIVAFLMFSPTPHRHGDEEKSRGTEDKG